MIGHKAIVVATACGGILAGSASAHEPDFFTSFEPDEAPPFVLGTLDGQNRWEVTAGSAVVQDTVSYHGLQAARFDPTGSTRAEWTSTRFQLPTHYVDVFVRVGDANPAVPDAPPLVDFSGARLQLDLADGLELFDGTGGTWVSTAHPILSNQWHRVTLRIDFAAATWDVAVDGTEVRTGLGLTPGSPPSFKFLRATPNRHALYLDGLAILATDPATDSDGDGLPDSDEEYLLGTDPQLPDTDDDDAEDGHEIIAGTDPTDPESYLDVVVRARSGVVHVEFPTVVGRLYTIERTDSINPPGWRPVSDPAFVDRVGTGDVVIYEARPGVELRYYRVKVRLP